MKSTKQHTGDNQKAHTKQEPTPVKEQRARDSASNLQKPSPKNPSLPQMVLNSLWRMLSSVVGPLAPYATIQNIVILLASIAMARFIALSVMQTMLYANILIIAYRVIHPKLPNEAQAIGSQLLRKTVLTIALAGIVLDFMIPTQSILSFLFFAPLACILVADQLHCHSQAALKHATSLKNASGAIKTVLESARSDWDYFLITTPYIHRAALGTLFLLTQISFFSATPALQTAYLLIGNQYLSPLLYSLSAVGGLNFLNMSKSAIFDYTQGKCQESARYVINSIQSNPLAASQLFSWATNKLYQLAYPSAPAGPEREQAYSPDL